MWLRADQRHRPDGRPRPLAAAVAILMVASQASAGLRRRGESACANACAGRIRRWSRSLVLALAAVLMLAACGGTGDQSAGGAPTLNWYIFPEPSGSFQAAAAGCSAASNGEYTIAIQDLPSGADDQREQLVRRSSAKDSSLDILGLDVVWEAEFAEAGWIVPWTGERRRQVEQDAVKAALDTATWKGQLVAAPFNSNTQLLWYRKDLVPNPPTTWAEMIGQAEALARQGKPHYIEIQGASYEGYTVWVNAMVLSAGGQILSDDGQQVVLGPPAQRGVELIGQLANSPAADPSLSVQMEDQNRLAFETGEAAFELNYPFVYPLRGRERARPGQADGLGRVPEGRRRPAVAAAGGRHRPGRQRPQPAKGAGL